MKTARKNLMVLVAVMASVLIVSSVSTAEIIFSTSGGSSPLDNGFTGTDITGVATNETPGNTGTPPTWKFWETAYGATSQYKYDLTSNLDLTRDWTIDMRTKVANTTVTGPYADLTIVFYGLWGKRVDCNFNANGTITTYVGGGTPWETVGTHNGGWVDTEIFYDYSAQNVTWSFSGGGSGSTTKALTSLPNAPQPGFAQFGYPAHLAEGFGQIDNFVSNLTLTPEPVTLSILAIGGVLALLRRRRA